MKKYKIYAKATCNYCNALIQELIDRKKTFYVEFLDGDPKKLNELKKRYNHHTVPIVILCEEKETVVGGCEETLKLLNREDEPHKRI